MRKDYVNGESFMYASFTISATHVHWIHINKRRHTCMMCHTVHDENERDQTTTIFRIMNERRRKNCRLHRNTIMNVKPSIVDWILKSILFNGSAVRDSRITYRFDDSEFNSCNEKKKDLNDVVRCLVVFRSVGYTFLALLLYWSTQIFFRRSHRQTQ